MSSTVLSPQVSAGYIITLCPEAPEQSWAAWEPTAETAMGHSTITTTTKVTTTTAWSCQTGDVVPCCADRQCLETCAGNQCCPDGTACPSATDNFTLCPAPRLYTCPPETTTPTTSAQDGSADDVRQASLQAGARSSQHCYVEFPNISL